MTFYLGTHLPTWLWDAAKGFSGIPLFVSNNSLKDRKSAFAPALTRWALDSGGFTEIKTHGRWTVSPDDYLAKIDRYIRELGSLDWAAPQDWMCEPSMIEKTELSVREHQERTIDNFLDLRSRAPHLPIIPVLQGWVAADYETCVRLYEEAGVDLKQEALVGVGSVCRRQGTNEILDLFQDLSKHGLEMHGFGVKTQGLARYGHLLASSDSMAWSYGARRRGLPLEGCVGHINCANCQKYALKWREDVLKKLEESLI